MNRFATFLALVAAVIASASVTASPLLGVWIEISGTGAARIAPCPQRPDALCAVGGERRRDGSLSIGGAIVLENVVAAGANRWRGQYIDGGRKLPASISMEGTRVVAMKVCLLIVCQTARYERVD